jgi:proteasome lid subunit RPN8/RPN11
MLRLPSGLFVELLAHCVGSLPDEACGLLATAPGDDLVVALYPTANAARSARYYRVEPKHHLLADRDAEALGLEIAGAFHSHTRSEPVPSETDLAQAPDPSWHYVVVSLAGSVPAVRSWRIAGSEAKEERLQVVHSEDAVAEEIGHGLTRRMVAGGASGPAR